MEMRNLSSMLIKTSALSVAVSCACTSTAADNSTSTPPNEEKPPIEEPPVESERPNFVVILLDDSGFADLGCYGGVVPTPNIDALAENGVRMSQMYNCARSCPTRASLLTGLYPQQAGVGHMLQDLTSEGGPGYQGYLSKNSLTLGQVMHENGYFTAMVGKWHVGHKHDGYSAAPWKRGFDRVLNSPGGGYYFYNDPKAELYLDGKKISNTDSRLPSEWYSTDLWTDYGLKFIDEGVDSGKPFFLYMAYNAPHFPLQIPESAKARFKGAFHEGWDVMRQRIYDNQCAMGLLGRNYPLTKRNPLIPLWKDVDEAQKQRSELIMEIYAAILSYVDDNIGLLVERLKEKGVFENTVFILLSDNGGNAEGKTVYGTFGGTNPGAQTSNIFLGQAWAESINCPFYLYKHHTHEGGISTPLIVSYPAGIPAARNGSVVHQPGHVIDIMATMVGMSNSKYPTQFNGNGITPMQGINLYDVWLGGSVVRPEPIFWEHEDNVAIRDGRWKLVKERKEKNYQLYDMEADRTETTDLADKEPEIMEQMMRKFEMMYNKVGAAKLSFPDNRWFKPVQEY